MQEDSQYNGREETPGSDTASSYRQCDNQGSIMFYVAYEDKGPSGPCGQSVECTRHHNDLYIFDDEESARMFISKARPNTSRVMPKITGFWSEDMGNVIATTR